MTYPVGHKDLQVRYPLTCLYSNDYSTHALNRRLRRLIRRRSPVTCLVIGLRGTGKCREAHRDLLDNLAGNPRSPLQLRSVHMTLPNDAATPIQLLRVSSLVMDRQMFVQEREAVTS